ncbi:MAG: lysoplasmalogenase family protein [Allosphingosinicella sp.]
MAGVERWLVAMSLVAGLLYPLLWGRPLEPAALIAAKGAGVGLLALAAAIRARSLDGWLLAAVMALGALGDVLLEIDFSAGASAFAAGHFVAIALYVRHRRGVSGRLDRAVAALLPATAAALPFLLLPGRPEAIAFVFYGALVGAMAAAAWMSRFPRPLAGAGAMLFLASDMLIALRLGSGAGWLSWPIWYLYYSGQLLIFRGVRRGLRATVIPAKAGIHS